MRCLLAAVGVLAGASLIQADPILWHLSDVVFDDGTTVTGSFQYDPSTHSYSQFNVSTSGGSSVPAENSWVLDPYNFWQHFSDFGFVAVDSTNSNLTGAHVLSLSGQGNSLADGIPVLDIEFGVVGTCSDPVCASHLRHTY